MKEFSEIPPYQAIKIANFPDSMPKAFEVYHSTASDPSYCSRGEQRAEETHCIFHYTVRGCGEVIRCGVRHSVHAGEGFFNIINEPSSGYGYPQEAREPWEFVVLCFAGENVRQIVSELTEKRTIFSLVGREALFAKLCAELCGNEQCAMMTLPQLIALLTSEDECGVRMINQFHRIVKRQLMQNPTVASVAREMNISREYLTRVYSAATGESPAKMIKRKRFEQLCTLLLTHDGFEEIARLMAFPSVAGMGIFFKSIAGVTLSEYRRNGYFSV